jgi:hypothetical protein
MKAMKENFRKLEVDGRELTCYWYVVKDRSAVVNHQPFTQVVVQSIHDTKRKAQAAARISGGRVRESLFQWADQRTKEGEVLEQFEYVPPIEMFTFERKKSR